jgi:hypothetical protein
MGGFSHLLQLAADIGAQWIVMWVRKQCRNHSNEQHRKYD